MMGLSRFISKKGKKKTHKKEFQVTVIGTQQDRRGPYRLPLTKRRLGSETPTQEKLDLLNKGHINCIT